MKGIEYRGVTSVDGPIVILKRTENVFYNETVYVRDRNGQKRTVALSLKLAELEIFKDECGEYPILLLDDVLSELDENRRETLLKLSSKVQTILTTTEYTEKIKPNLIIKINNGKAELINK